MARHSREYWRKLNAEYESGGGTIVEISARHGVNAGTFSWWRRFFRRETEERQEFLPILVAAPQPESRMSFEIGLRNGISLRFETALADLVTVVESLESL